MKLHLGKGVFGRLNKKFFHKNWKKILAIVVIGGSLSTVYYSSSYSTAVGTLGGKFSVSANGAAVYEIPIDVVPGTNGVTPQLTLVYNNQSPEGYLGAGFTLSGISAITRCSYIENYNLSTFQRYPVTNTSTDHFCLDGIELVAVEGSYGADGTKYKTKQDNWTQVISHGNCGGGPCYFTAKNRQGHSLEFGVSNDSRVQAAGTQVIGTWAMNKYSDLNSNYTQIEYSNDASGVFYYPSKISYTGNSTTGQAPQRFIEFEYENRAYEINSYVNGSLKTIPKVLVAIKTYLGSTAVSSYNFEYKENTSTSPYEQLYEKQLISVQKCAATSCLPKTIFDWQNNLTTQGKFLSSQTIPANYPYNYNEIAMLGDVDNDGRDDLVKVLFDSKFLVVFLGDGTGGFKVPPMVTDAPSLPSYSSILGIYAKDINGDNKADIVLSWGNGNGKFSMGSFISNGNATFQDERVTNTDESWNTTGAVIVGDTNSDGVADIIQVRNLSGRTSFITYLSKKDGYFDAGIHTDTTQSYGQYGGWGTGDQNGDGKVDITQKVYSSFVTYLSNGQGSFANGVVTNNLGSGPLFDRYFLADFNNDNKSDLLYTDNTSSQDYHLELLTSRSKANGYFDPQRTAAITGKRYGGLVGTGDTNWDGKEDLVALEYLDPLVFYTQLSTGTGVFSDPIPSSFPTEVKNGTYMLGDITGDGRVDIVNLQKDSSGRPNGVIKTFYTLQDTTGVITKITNGLDAAIAINYDPISDSNAYCAPDQCSASASYPVQNIETPLDVVVSYSTCDVYECSATAQATPTNHQYTYNYEYSGAQYDVERGTLLGFKTIKASTGSAGNSRYALTTYKQNYPMQGLVEEVEYCVDNGTTSNARCSKGNGNLMAKVGMNYRDISTNSNLNSVVLDYVRLFRFGTDSATAKMVLSKTFEYDAYGNVTLMSNLGNVNTSNVAITDDDNYPLYTCTVYRNNESQWQFGYPLETKLTSDPQSCSGNNFSNWNSAWDLQWTKMEYDSYGNVTTSEAYDNILNTWLAAYSEYDSYGNVVATISPSGNPTGATGTTCTSNPTRTCITYDSTYHTFVNKIESPEINSAHNRLTIWQSYNPALGVLLYHTDQNGSSAGDEAHSIFYDYDEFGRITQISGPNNDGVKTVLSTINLYDLSSGYSQKTLVRPSWSENDQANWYWVQNYHDGFGRQNRQKSRAKNQSGAEDNIVTQTYFNIWGQVGASTLPYFESTGSTSDDGGLGNWANLPCDNSTVNTAGWSRAIYNSYNQLSCMVGPDGTAQNISYSYASDDSGLFNLMRITTTSAYDTAESTNETSYINGQGFLIQKIAANGSSIYYKYNPLGKLLAITMQPYSSTSCTQLQKGTTCFEYDSLGRITKKSSNDTGVETYTYNAQGRPVQVANNATDTNATSVQYIAYDNLDRLTQKISTFKNYSGTSTSRTDNFVYDSAVNGKGFLYEINASEGSSSSEIYSKNFLEYDPYGNMILGTVTLPQTIAGSDNELNYQKEYDPLGHVVSYTYPDASVQKSVYSNDTTLSSVSMCEGSSGCDAASDYHTYATYSQYNAMKVPQRVVYGNGVSIAKEYYPVSGESSSSNAFLGGSYALKSISGIEPSTQTELFGQSYSWNRNGQLKNIEKSAPSSSSNDFTYDSDKMGFLSHGYDSSFSYDHSGNIKLKDGEDYTYTSGTDWLTSSDLGWSMSYYTNGNLKQKNYFLSQWNYSYDAMGNLNSVNTSQLSENYFYDSLGNQLYKKWQNGNQEITTIYWAPGYETDEYPSRNSKLSTKYVGGLTGPVAAISGAETPLNETVAAKNGNQNHLKKSLMFLPLLLLAALLFLFKSRKKTKRSRHKKYFWLIFFAAFCAANFNVDPAQANITAGTNGKGLPTANTTRYFIQDHLGSTVIVTDTQGDQTASVGYDSYGSIVEADSSGIDDFRPKFSGKEWSMAGNFYNFGLRFYDPILTRFISPDPAAQYLSPYLYSGNSPQSFVDPSGSKSRSLNPWLMTDTIYLTAKVSDYIINSIYDYAVAAPNASQLNDNTNFTNEDDGAGGAETGQSGIYAGASNGAPSGFLNIVSPFGQNATFGAMGGNVTSAVVSNNSAVAQVTGSLSMEEVSSQFYGGDLLNIAHDGVSIGNDFGFGGALNDCTCVEDEPSSFVGGTKVETESGPKNIEDLKIHDKVLGFNFKTKKVGFYEVIATRNRKVGNIIEIVIDDGEKIRTTAEHPFYLQNKSKYVQAEKLTAADILQNRKGEGVAVKSVKKVGLSLRKDVYNLSVSEVENYFVSDVRVLVHNVLTACAENMIARTGRPSWQGGTRNTRCEVGSNQNNGGVEGYVLTAGGTHIDVNATIIMGTRTVSALHIDHETPWSYLLHAARTTPQLIDAPTLRAIYNYRDNLRLLTAQENVSHRFEPQTPAQRQAAVEQAAEIVEMMRQRQLR